MSSRMIIINFINYKTSYNMCKFFYRFVFLSFILSLYEHDFAGLVCATLHNIFMLLCYER